MNITTEEARQALQLIERTSQRVRRDVLRYTFAPFAILWGGIWLIGFLSTALLARSISQLVWIVAVIVGWVASFLIGNRQRQRVQSMIGKRLALSWLVFAVYAMLWLWLVHPADPVRGSVLLVSMIMAAYVVQGIWLWRGQALLGLAITALALISGLLFPAYYPWWMALLGGGALLGVGLYIWFWSRL